MILNSILIALALVLVVGFIVQRLPKSPEQHFDALYQRFLRERRGSSHDDQMAEFALRSAAARLRRLASAEALQRPQDHRAIIDRIAKDEAMKLASRDRAMGRDFVSWVGTMEVSDILYPEAFKAVYAYNVPAKTVTTGRRSDLRDSIAALTVLK